MEDVAKHTRNDLRSASLLQDQIGKKEKALDLRSGEEIFQTIGP